MPKVTVAKAWQRIYVVPVPRGSYLIQLQMETDLENTWISDICHNHAFKDASFYNYIMRKITKLFSARKKKPVIDHLNL